MPISSAQISGMIGGQQVMFSNQHGYSQQIGGMHGTGPQMPAPSMQSPQFPSYGDPAYGAQEFGPWSSQQGAGARVVGAGAMAAPTALAGGLMAMGVMGGPDIDPFSMGLSGFRRGSGAMRGAGVAGTMRHVGGRFAAGGLRGGLGAIGGGLAGAAAGAAVGAVPLIAAEQAAGAVYQGAQQTQDVGRLTQQWGPAFGSSGVRPGGRMGRDQVRNIVGILENIAGDNVMASVGTLTRLMEKFDRMGMMTGVTDASTFKRKFTRLVDQVDTLAKVMGTSLEEAAPVMANMQRMGLWTTKDIVGTGMASQMVGQRAQPAMMGAMQQGAMQSWQAGGTLRAGAMGGQRQFLAIQSAMRTGSLSEQQLREFTGGTGGMEGQQQLAGMMTGAMSGFAKSPMGRLMVAGLGETAEGRFTGRIDQGRLRAFQSGRIGIEDLKKRGRAATRTREGAASFTFNQAQIGQGMMAEGGMGAVGEAIQQVMDRAGYGDAGEDIQGIFMQRMMGMDERQARAWQGMLKELPRIKRDQQRRAEDAIENAFRRADERANRSFAGFKDAIKHRYENMLRPLREIGADVTTSVNEALDDATNFIMQRSPQGVRVSQAERQQTLAGGGFGRGMQGLRARGMSMSSVDVETPWIRQLATGTTTRESLLRMGLQTTGQGGAGRVNMAEGLTLGEGVAAAGIGVGAGLLTGGAMGLTAGAAAATAMGMGEARTADPRDVAEMMRGAAARAQTASAAGLRFGGKEARADLDVIRQEFMRVISDPKQRVALREAKKRTGGTGEYSAEVMRMVKERGGGRVAQALERLKGTSGMRQMAEVERSALRAVSEGTLLESEDMSVEWMKEAKAINAEQLMTTPKALREQGQKALEEFADVMERGLTTVKQTPAYLIAKGAPATTRTSELTMSKKEIINALNNPEWGYGVRAWLKNRNSKEAKRFEEAAVKDPTARKLLENLDRLSTKSPKIMGELMQASEGVELIAQADIDQRASRQLASSAETEIAALERDGMTGGTAQTQTEYRKILQDMAKTGDVKTQQGALARATELGRRLAESTSPEDKAALEQMRMLGGVGAQVATAAGIEQLTTGGQAIGKRAFRRKLAEAGIGRELMGALTEDQRAVIERVTGEGGAGGRKVTETEMTEVKEMLRQAAENLALISGGGKEDAMTSMQNTFTKYMNTNMKFQAAITHYIVEREGINLGEVQDRYAKATDTQKDETSTPATQEES
jgi:hypothetical protein